MIDSWFDNYAGVVMLLRVFDGRLRRGQRIRFLSTGADYVCEGVGVFTPKAQAREELGTGEVGYVTAGIRELGAARVGDTVTLAEAPARAALPGFKEIRPQVFAGLYPVEPASYGPLRDALAKLRLNDPALRFEPETSRALGAGFRCGFLGLLHLEIVQERLEREYGVALVSTAPSVVYQVALRDGSLVEVDNPSRLPSILVPPEHVGAVITLCNARPGLQRDLRYLGRQALLVYELPFSEVVSDFFDRLKSVSRGFASFDYEPLEYRAGELEGLDVLINGERVDALSQIVHRAAARARGRELAARLRQRIPRQMFDVAVQAAVGSQVVARETVKALRKNVLAKCYGGDVTRKKKLIERQKAGKRRMKRVGRVDIPQEAFHALLRVER